MPTQTWDDIKRNLNERKVNLDNTTNNSAINQIASQINLHIKDYAYNAGISTNPDNNNAKLMANQSFDILIQKDKEYQRLITELSTELKNTSSDGNINSKLATIGTLGANIRDLNKELNTVKKEASISTTRKESMENPDMNVSWYQGFASKVGFNKPLHQISISILLGFGILLLILSGLMLKELFNPGQENIYIQSSQYEGVFSLFTDSRMYSVLGAIILVFVVVSILSYNGYLGKSST